MNLTAERLNRGLSLTAAARAMGVHRKTLTALESGARAHPESAKKVADFYGCQVVDVMPVEDVQAA